MEEGRKKRLTFPIRLCLWYIILYTDNKYLSSPPYVSYIFPFLFIQFLSLLIFILLHIPEHRHFTPNH